MVVKHILPSLVVIIVIVLAIVCMEFVKVLTRVVESQGNLPSG